jgi:hypothetical protein
MQRKQSVVIRQISRNRAEQMGYYRFLENENVSISELGRSFADHCEQQVEGLHVLSVSDTSEINLHRHKGRLKPEGQGVVGNNKNIGFFIHPTLTLNAETGFPLGLSDVHLWARPKKRPTKEERDYSTQPIEEKESFKWLRSAEKSERCLRNGGARMVTHICDREGDLFEEWARVPNAQTQTHLLIRACRDRRLLGQKTSLYAQLSAQPCEGTYTVQVLEDPRRKRTAREALLMVRRSVVHIQRPDKISAEDYPDSIRLYAVEAKELCPPPGEKPIHWRLLTTHEVVCIEQALQVIQWYCWRWHIEQLFATLKRAGLNLEATQLTTVAAIQRLTILALSVALRTLQLVFGRERPDLPASLAFDAPQMQCLCAIAPSFQGSTPKQQNPHPPLSLPWAAWIIARIGGWSGYRSQRPPGMPTMIHGLREFLALFFGWTHARTSLVCRP